MIPMRIIVAPIVMDYTGDGGLPDRLRSSDRIERFSIAATTTPDAVAGILARHRAARAAGGSMVHRLGTLDHRPLERSAAADGVYEALREAIVARRLLPGDRLAEEQLAKQFGVSRTPVREALLRLEAEQFATRVARRGLVVRPIPEREVLEVYAVRAALDGLAATLAAEQATPPDLARLRWISEQIREAASTSDYSRMAELNIELHEALCDAAHNGMLLHFMRQIHDWVRRFGESDTTFARPGRAAVATDEHDGIIEAIAAGDAERAGILARVHMNGAREARIAMLRERVQPEG
jgi:DNA-binding GntR family transcriptional regulator